MRINGNDLLDNGWEAGFLIGDALKEAKNILDSNPSLSRDEVISRITTPKRESKQVMRSEPLPIEKAVDDAGSEDHLNNIASAEERIKELSKCPVVKRASLMPDTCPAGNAEATIPVGGCIEVDNAIVPAAHSADVCCSMMATFFKSDLSTKELMDNLVSSTHFGFCSEERVNDIRPSMKERIENLCDNNYLLKDLKFNAVKDFASQGDGNHFAFLGKVELSDKMFNHLAVRDSCPTPDTGEKETYKVLVTHHGSRSLGAKLYKKGVSLAENFCKRNAKDIPKAAQWIPYDLEEGQAYWRALQKVRLWARANHLEIANKFTKNIRSEAIFRFFNEHNFVWKRGRSFYHGKGATPAWDKNNGFPSIGLIPMNMGEPILIASGRGNERYLSFAPHGAGRDISRSALKRKYDKEFQIQNMRSIRGRIDLRWYLGESDFSELPIAYKSSQWVEEQIKQHDLASVVSRIYPLGCVMAGAVA